MSELNVYHHELRHNEYEEFYLKYEADKVIAEKDKTIAELKKACNDKDDWCLHTLKENRHHKYKRCLAMARWCRIHDEFTQLESERLGLSQRALFIEYRRKAMWWNKWHKHWLGLAKKFKEAK